MTDRSRTDDDLERDVERALRERGELIPVSDEEVLAAERELVHAGPELPDGLRQYRGRRPTAPTRRASAWPGYAAAGLLGAAAASVLWLAFAPEKPQNLSGAGRDLVRPSASAPAAKPALIEGRDCAASCCGGDDCPSAAPALKACPSGQRCIACTSPQSADGPFRLRLGTMVLSEAGQKLLDPNAAPPLELCVVTPGAAPACLPALSGGTGDDQWRLLPRVSSSQDLLSGLSVEVRRQGSGEALASWKYPVVAAPEVFCKGLAIQPRQGTDVVGRVSAFVEQTHFVELGRADSLAALRARRAEFEFRAVSPRVYETTQPGARFALVLGPLDKATAQALRWSVLEADKQATLGFGLDFVGEPQPLP